MGRWKELNYKRLRISVEGEGWKNNEIQTNFIYFWYWIKIIDSLDWESEKRNL